MAKSAIQAKKKKARKASKETRNNRFFRKSNSRNAFSHEKEKKK